MTIRHGILVTCTSNHRDERTSQDDVIYMYVPGILGPTEQPEIHFANREGHACKFKTPTFTGNHNINRSHRPRGIKGALNSTRFLKTTLGLSYLDLADYTVPRWELLPN